MQNYGVLFLDGETIYESGTAPTGGLIISNSSAISPTTSGWTEGTYNFNTRTVNAQAKITGNSHTVYALHNARNTSYTLYMGYAVSNVASANVPMKAQYRTQVNSFNTWAQYTSVGDKRYYAITTNSASNASIKSISIDVSTGHSYTFKIHTYCQATYDGVVISKGSVPAYKSSISSYTDSNVLWKKAGTGSSDLSTYTYTPTTTETIYLCFSQNASTMSFGSGLTNIADVELVDDYISSYDTPVVTGYSYANYGAGGATKNPTVTYSQTAHWTNGDTTTITTGGTLAFTAGTLPSGCSKGTGTTYVFATKGGIKWASRSTTIGNSRNAASVLSVTVTMNGKTSAAFTCTSCKQNGNYVTSITPIASSGYTEHFHYEDIGAGATSASPTAHGSATYTFTSGSSTTTKPGTSYGTATYSRAYTLASSQNGFTAVNATTGVLTATSRGTTIGNARTSATVTSVLTVTWVHSSTYSAGGTVTSSTMTSTGTCTQEGNYVTGVTPRASSGTAHFSYANIGAGATSASPTLTGAATYTFSSGSTSTSTPDGGSASYSRTYTLASSQNGFTAVNASTGVLTATNRAKTTGAARTSATVTSVLTVTYTHNSTYSAGGTVSGTMTSTGTCTQEANILTWGNVSLTVSSPATPYAMNKAGEGVTINASAATQTGTYSSGSTDTYTPTLSYTVKTAKTGYSLSSNVVTVTNNTSTSARNGFVVTVTATGKTGTNSTYITGYNKTATSDRTFNQAAGAKVYDTPTVSTYAYSVTANTGVTDKAPTTPTYSQTWTWNGVSGSGGTITSGGTLAYTTTGTLPSRFSTGTNFATTGKITWGNNNTASAKDAKSNLQVTVTLNGKTSAAKTCTACSQSAGAKVYSTPSITKYTYATTAKTGVTDRAPSVTYSIPYTWNGVDADSGADTSGGTLAYSCATGTPARFSTGTDFATTGKITWGNNNTTSSKNAKSYLTVTVTKGSLTSESYTCTACSQSAGTRVYEGTPTINTYNYTSTSPTGVSGKAPNSITYSMPFTWNGVAADSGTRTTGGTLTYTTTGTLPSGFSVADDFATSGKINWTNNTTTSAKDAKSNLRVTVTTPSESLTSAAFTCTNCPQQAGAKVYEVPTLSGSYTYTTTANTGATDKAPNATPSYSQVWTWNGVSGSGGTLTSGQTVTYNYTAGTLPTGFTKGTNFATTGKINWANNTSTSTRDAKSNLKVTVTTPTGNKISTAFTCTNCPQQAGAKVYEVPTLSGSYTYATAAAAGVTNASPSATPSYSQVWTWNGVSGSGGTITTGGTYGYSTTGTLPSGFSTGTNFATTGKITWANNTTTSAKDAKSNLKVTVTLNGKTSSALTCTACSQSAGAQVYETPTVLTYSYENFPASGGARTPITPTYSQVWTWNGVSGSGGTLTSGGTLAYTKVGSLPSGFQSSTNFDTTGNVVWANRTTTAGDARDAKSNLTVKVTMNGKTSATKTCTSCLQEANAVESLEIDPSTATIPYQGTTTISTRATYTSGSEAVVEPTYSMNPSGIVSIS